MEARQEKAYQQMRESERGPIINIKANLKTLNESLDIAIKEINEFRRQKKSLRNEINTLHQVVKRNNESVLNHIGPELQHCMKEMKHEIKFQRRINEDVQENLNNIHVWAQKLRDVKNNCKVKIGKLEEAVGIF